MQNLFGAAGHAAGTPEIVQHFSTSTKRRPGEALVSASPGRYTRVINRGSAVTDPEGNLTAGRVKDSSLLQKNVPLRK